MQSIYKLKLECGSVARVQRRRRVACPACLNIIIFEVTGSADETPRAVYHTFIKAKVKCVCLLLLYAETTD